MIKKSVLIISLMLVLVLVGLVTATNCWETTYNTQATCEANADCKWHTDPWGSWCEQKGCWNQYSQTGCLQSGNGSSSYNIGKNCSWQASQSVGWCMEMSCWGFSGTTENTCENSGLGCNWVSTYNANTYDYPCQGSADKNCWQKQTSTECTAVAGCTWGLCEQVSCWDQTTAAACVLATGSMGNACKWNSQYNYCYESSCWDHTTVTACQAAGCKWDGGMCSQQWCSDFGYKNESYCEQNTVGLNCNWNDPWCEEKSCWSSTDSASCALTNSSSGKECYWQTSATSGWCEDVGCWQWDSMKGGKENTCLSNGATYGLSCVWNNDSYTAVNTTDGWCYENIASKTCVDVTRERDCIDTMYCFWNYSSTACQEPVGVLVTEFIAWNPGCYIFDYVGASACNNVTGCTWTAGTSSCDGNSTIINTDPTIGGLKCSYINNSNMCGQMTMLSSCCEWQAGSCAENKFTNKCWDQMQETSEGAAYCEDYNSFTDQTLCNQISGDPWYMPCKWDNKSTTDTGDDRCTFKSDKIFEAGKENLIFLDSKQSCESAGGKWVVDMYASSSDPHMAVALPMGHCEENFGGKRTCDAECYACNYKEDGTNHSSAKTAESACYGSKLGMCGFTTDATAPNHYGYCKPKTEFAKGIAKNCDEDCGSCSYMGSSTAAEAVNKPSTYCTNSKVTGGCKWIPDIDYPTDESKGRCAKKAEKTCEDRCDLCTSQDNCVNKGKKSGNTTMNAQCSWNSNTGTCSLVSGGDQMEVCWDGTDNNNNGKMDCADSQCFSDSFCGGGFMAGFGGKDCFGSTTQSDCTAAGCVWMTENWGSWCDMPGSNCWKKDGDATACGLDGNCSWHSGFGGFCEENWTMAGSTTTGCMSYNQSNCAANITNSCIWVQDQFYQDNNVGGAMGWCDPDWGVYIGTWFADCATYDYLGEGYCEAAGTADVNGVKPCKWYNSTGGSGSGGAPGDSYSGGWCDHMKFACSQFSTQVSCTEKTNATYNHSEYCVWKQSEWGGMCEGKAMSGTGSVDSCWNQADNTACTAANCVWKSGFCDPAGFGSDMGFGGASGGGAGMGSDFTAMGGMGSNCFQFNGNQTGCEASQGCGWFAETTGFCDINKQSNCPQYSYNSTICNAQSRCIYNAQAQFCDEKPFACFWNESYRNGQNDLNVPGLNDSEECKSNSLCHWASWNSCEPVSFNASVNSANLCNKGYNVTNGSATVAAFIWISGWCNPGMTSQFFKDMQGGAPVPLGTDIRGDVSPSEVDIVDYGMKDMGSSFGFGIKVASIVNASMCNGIKLSGGMSGTGYNETKFYWYLDTDGVATGGCTTQDSGALAGFEFYFKNTWAWSTSSGSNVETTEAYKCESGSWKKASIPLTTFKQKSCAEVGGGMIAVEKAELEKFSTLYITGGDIRVYVATANATGNVTNPTDTISTSNVGYATPGAVDQDIDDLDLYAFKNASKKVGEGSNKGYIEYADVDCWTQTGCADYQCKDHPYCVEKGYGVEAAGFVDTRAPKIVGLVKETYSDSAIIKFWTDKPSNGSLEYFGPSEGCPVLSNPYPTVPSINNESGVRDYTLAHIIELTAENMGGSLAANGVTGYFRLTFCDNMSKCGISQCSAITYETTGVKGAFDNFVTKIEAPSGWNVSYDLNQDKTYEFDQNAFIATTNKTLGMKTNYSDGRRANIKLIATDNSSWIEFKDVKLTKTGVGSSNIRKVDDTGDFVEGTTTDASGNTLGYVGMVDETRDQIVNNLFPEKCLVKFPKGDAGCTSLWHCNSDNTKCIDRTAEAILNETGSDYCIWEIPYCEFSNWGGGQPGSAPGSSSGGGGGGGSGEVCTLGAISCQGTMGYQECILNATTKKNIFSAVKSVPAGKICKAGALVGAETAEEAKKEAAEETKAQEAAISEVTPAITEESKAGTEAKQPSKILETFIGLSWLWTTLVIVIIGVLVIYYIKKK